jgi:microtubule-associated protein, RP/EB family
MKRFWDSNFGGQGYDPISRRKGAPTDTPATVAPIRSGGAPATGNLGVGAGRAGGRTPVGGHRTGSAQGGGEVVQGLQAQVREMSVHLEGLEKERDFYFAKVRLFFLLSTTSIC